MTRLHDLVRNRRGEFANPIYLSAIVLFLSASLAQAAIQPPSQATPLPPEQASKEGRALVHEILGQRPSENATNTGVMTMVNQDGERTRVPVHFEVFNTPAGYVTIYSAGSSRGNSGSVKIVHQPGKPNEYFSNVNNSSQNPKPLTASQINAPFAPNSDFWITDLGLEFFHWPEQHVIKKEMKRSRACRVLESVNPHPAPNGYSRVVSWIDNESHGIVMANAYDSHGNLLKEFIPKKVKKVEGQWQLEEMEIDNDQTGSTTIVNFDLAK